MIGTRGTGPQAIISSTSQEQHMTQNEQLDINNRSNVKGDGDLLALRKFAPYFQKRCRELINDGCITGIIRNNELCIRYSEIIHYTAPGYDLPLP
jgi:hypothetical protein